ncbi:hypothetical protein BGZ65_003028, partial [Modicella reniformis]
MDWLVDKTGAFLNTSAAVLDNVVQSGSRFEATLSPAAMRVVKSKWVAERPLTKSVRHLTVKAVWSEDDERSYYSGDSHQNERPRLMFLPGMGSHILYHKGYKVSVSRDRPDHAAGADTEQTRILASIQKKQSLTISTFGWDMSLLKMILQ